MVFATEQKERKEEMTKKQAIKEVRKRLGNKVSVCVTEEEWSHYHEFKDAIEGRKQFSVSIIRDYGSHCVLSKKPSLVEAVDDAVAQWVGE